MLLQKILHKNKPGPIWSAKVFCSESGIDIVQGSRLLARIHDPLHLARNMVFMEVDPAAHFAPVTKPLPAVHHSRIPASVSPSRDTVADTSGAARFAVLALHRRYLAIFYICRPLETTEEVNSLE